MKNQLETGRRTPIKSKQQETCNPVGWGKKASFQDLHPWEGSDTRRRTFTQTARRVSHNLGIPVLGPVHGRQTPSSAETTAGTDRSTGEA